MKKRFLKTRPVCKVTFDLPKAAAEGARRVALVGEFNNWDPGSTSLKRRRDGSFSVTVDLECNRQYQFRYLIDGSQWENDWNADGYAPSPLGGSDNSVVVV